MTDKRQSPMKGRKQTPAQKAAGAANLASGHKHQAELRAAREAGIPTRYELYKRGELKVTDLDDEEVAQQRFRDRAGGFNGRPPVLTGKQQAEFRRELLRRGQRSLDSMYIEALGVLKEIAKSAVAEDRDRLKAADMLIQRVAGKVPDRVELGPVDAFSGVLEGIIDVAVKDAPGEEA